jgi:CubicO group peptidase (beta-lactamase class C family)
MLFVHRVSSLAALVPFVVAVATWFAPTKVQDAAVPAAAAASADERHAQLEARIDALLDQHHALDQFSGAILVADGGRIVYQGARGEADSDWGIANSPATKFRLASVTKQFTAMVVLQLVRDGMLELDAPMTRYLADYPAESGDRVTIRHLLNHTSGIPSYTDRPGYFEQASKMRYGVSEFVAEYCSEPLEFEPGSRYSYNNSGYFLLGAIVERVTGRTYAQVLAERIFEPLGMTDSGVDDQYRVIPGRATGYDDVLGGRRVALWLDMSTPFAAGAVYSTVGDLWKWDRALSAKTLLDGELERAMTTPGLGDYAFGWEVAEVPAAPDVSEGGDARAADGDAAAPARLVHNHSGGMPGVSSLIWREPAGERCIIVLGNTYQTEAFGLRQGVSDILDGREPQPVRARGDLEIARMLLTQGSEVALANLAMWPQNVRDDLMKPDITILGHQMLEQQRYEDAIALGEFLTLAFPDAPEAWDALAQFQRATGDREAALASYRKALELDPGDEALQASVAELAGE